MLVLGKYLTVKCELVDEWKFLLNMSQFKKKILHTTGDELTFFIKLTYLPVTFNIDARKFKVKEQNKKYEII